MGKLKRWCKRHKGATCSHSIRQYGELIEHRYSWIAWDILNKQTLLISVIPWVEIVVQTCNFIPDAKLYEMK